MDDSITIFINELKNRLVSRYKIIGISSELILENRIFPKNSDISPFLKSVFLVEYKEYVFKSRTVIISRITRLIDNSSATQLEKLKKNLYEYLNNINEDINKIEPIITSGVKERKN